MSNANAHSLGRAAAAFLTYRLHTPLLTFLLALTAYLDVMGRLSLEAVLVALSFSLLICYAYLINKVTDAAEDAANAHADAIAAHRQAPTLIAGLACLLLPLPYLLILGNTGVLVTYTFGAILGFLYSFPTALFGATFRLKQVFGLKTIISSIGWTLSVVAIFFLVHGILGPFWIWLCALIFAATGSVEIVWDIRDMAGDARHGIHTVPNTLGVPAAKAVALALLALAGFAGYELSLGLSSSIALLLSVAFVLAASPARGKWFYHAILFVWIAALALYLLAA
jgi:4-hydroxybenzoate polyprenyltransferase